MSSTCEALSFLRPGHGFTLQSHESPTELDFFPEALPSHDTAPATAETMRPFTRFHRTHRMSHRNVHNKPRAPAVPAKIRGNKTAGSQWAHFRAASPNTMDAIVDAVPIGPAGLAVSGLFWVAVYHLGKFCSALAVPGVYNALAKRKKDEWDNYVMAWVHSALSAVVRDQRFIEFIP